MEAEMTRTRWQAVRALLEEALQLPPAERSAWLAENCRGNDALRSAVESLLHYETADDELAETALCKLSESTLAVDWTDIVEGSDSWRIGPYEIERELGHGGMGAVYLAQRIDEHYRQRVAIKFIRRGMDSPFALQRFRAERQILATFNHPNIARLFDGGTTTEGQPYLVMEYIEGQALNRYCADRQLDTQGRLQLFRQVCAAVHYAHQHLIIHRDLKPSNILVTKEGVPKLLDFGIAKLLVPESGELNPDMPTLAQTMTGMHMLTPAYASPEQVKGGAITTATDVYALGVMLYELLTGRSPYRANAESVPELLKAVCEEEPERPSNATARVAHRARETNAQSAAAITDAKDASFIVPRSALRGDLDNIVLMALRKEPQRRYASVEQLSEDLRCYLAGLPVSARKDTFGYRAQKFVRRNKVATFAAAIILLTLLGGLFGINQQRRRAERRFNEVRKLAHSVVFELHDAIEKLPGSTPARALLVQRSIEYLDSLAQEASSDVSLQRELATAYERIAGIQGNPYVANLGDGAGSLQSYRRALALRETILQKEPQDATAQLDVAQSLLSMNGSIEYAEGADAALLFSRRALQLSEAVAARQLQEPRLNKLLRSSHEAIGNALAGKNDFKGALEHYRKSLTLIESQCNADQPIAEKAACLRSLAIGLRKVGDAEWKTGDKKVGLETAQRALAQFEALATADPNDAQARFALTAQHTALGNYLWEQQDLPGALQHYTRALQLDEVSVKDDPANVQLRRSLVANANNVGYVLAQQGDAVGARKRCDQSLAELESLLKTNLTAPGLLNMAKEIYGYDGEINAILAEREGIATAESRHYWQAALKSFQRSLDILHQLKEKGLVRPSDAQQEDSLQREIAKCANKISG